MLHFVVVVICSVGLINIRCIFGLIGMFAASEPSFILQWQFLLLLVSVDNMISITKCHVRFGLHRAKAPARIRIEAFLSYYLIYHYLVFYLIDVSKL